MDSQIYARRLAGALALLSSVIVTGCATTTNDKSITIVDAFSFSARGQVFVVPVAAVDEVIEIEPGRLTRAPQRAGALLEIKLVERRGAAVPAFHSSSSRRIWRR